MNSAGRIASEVATKTEENILTWHAKRGSPRNVSFAQFSLVVYINLGKKHKELSQVPTHFRTLAPRSYELGILAATTATTATTAAAKVFLIGSKPTIDPLSDVGSPTTYLGSQIRDFATTYYMHREKHAIGNKSHSWSPIGTDAKKIRNKRPVLNTHTQARTIR